MVYKNTPTDRISRRKILEQKLHLKKELQSSTMDCNKTISLIAQTDESTKDIKGHLPLEKISYTRIIQES